MCKWAFTWAHVYTCQCSTLACLHNNPNTPCFRKQQWLALRFQYYYMYCMIIILVVLKMMLMLISPCLYFRHVYTLLELKGCFNPAVVTPVAVFNEINCYSNTGNYRMQRYSKLQVATIWMQAQHSLWCSCTRWECSHRCNLLVYR